MTQPLPDLEPAALTYGLKLIAEAIEAHFGERNEDYDEDVDDTSNHDAWTSFDALSARSVPEAGKAVDGLVLVPREPTPEMVSAGMGEIPEDGSEYDDIEDAWRAMIAAAPAALASVPAPSGAEPVAKKRYCQCNSLTNPCIVCGLPKFIDPTWLKRKIEEDPDEGEIGAGFELFPAPQAPAEGKFIAEWRTNAEIEAGVQLDASAAANETGLTERLRGPAFGTPTALQAADIIDKLQADVETWKTRAERLADMHRDMCVVAGETEARATASEAEATSLRRKLEEAERDNATLREDALYVWKIRQRAEAAERKLEDAERKLKEAAAHE